MTALRLAIPSSGALEEGAQSFLRSCGLSVWRDNPRRYTGILSSLPGVEVLFQRQSDITTEVDGGSADLGIVGLDSYLESRLENGDTRSIGEGAGFGLSQLVIAVPDSWADITTVADLAELALEYREKGRDLRIATKYRRLVKRFLDERGIYYASLVPSSGGIEAAPIMGYADLIADITASGVTLRENQLRPLTDGVVIESQATLIGNVRLLSEDKVKLALTREILERIEASRRSHRYQRISLNLTAASMDDAAAKVLKRPELSGIDGPSLSKVFSNAPGDWFNVQVVIPRDSLLKAVDYFRSLGGTAITVTEASYVFRKECESYLALEKAIAEYRGRQG
ncbi:MAG: ATP phosphoribosyltransferase [Chloroflexi bacterium]|nr:ATP phosphoribosyltransferase [Chloroflexota bacterium]